MSFILHFAEIDFQVETFGVSQEDLIKGINIYPNPATDHQITITAPLLSDKHADVELFNMIGQQLYNTSVKFNKNGQKNIRLSSYQAGVYFIRLSHDDQSVHKRIIIE